MTADRRRESLLRLAEVMGRTGLSRTTIYNRMKAGTFPHCLRISAGLVAWYESDVDAWVNDPMGWRAPAIAA
ncbi:AlpA family transcriptional regulator [Novosphingobium sp. PhB55]|uniref:helix-turn-helix transcriptional regulator n=1 Tax=Novosphingobium sp. PhB55 TaxID=2485106 RepID=UPI0010662790|nr:AlpA family phage regulatory protein [Novosphingobium sp. PhB55]TDW65388.1 AlpA family transcriptional regulator [Novosphingobium sp. PhB55]